MNGNSWKAFQILMGVLIALLAWVGTGIAEGQKRNSEELARREASSDAVPALQRQARDTNERVVRLEEGQKRNDDAHKAILREIRNMQQ